VPLVGSGRKIYGEKENKKTFFFSHVAYSPERNWLVRTSIYYGTYRISLAQASAARRCWGRRPASFLEGRGPGDALATRGPRRLRGPPRGPLPRTPRGRGEPRRPGGRLATRSPLGECSPAGTRAEAGGNAGRHQYPEKRLQLDTIWTLFLRLFGA